MTLDLSPKNIIRWLDKNLLFLCSLLLIAFIPLYPKLPLFDILPGYIVRVRIEDFLILGAAIIWFIQFLRGKVKWKTPVFWVMVAYAIVGFLSGIFAVFLTKTVPLELLHVGKTYLHFFRYLEYFSLFAIFYGAIETKKQVQVLLGALVVAVTGITVYGFGQRFWYWPVYSTMNREFSKGIRLYLTEHARLQSTFGGHYDLAAYLVVALPLILALAFNTDKKILKIVLHLVHLAGLWLLIQTASRISFGGYVVGVGVVLALTALNQVNWPHKIWWGMSRGLIAGVVLLVMFMAFGDEIYSRFLQVLQGYPKYYVEYQTVSDQVVLFTTQTVPVALGLKQLPSIPKADKPDNAMSTDEAGITDASSSEILANNALTPTDTQPSTQRPSDVYVDVPDSRMVATVSASGAASMVEVTGPRVYSDCALKKGLSECIRYETLWPMAIAGFKRDPLFGSGYATLTKTSVGEFTEAESTDNNFLRTLGETGLLGFITFYGVILTVNWLLFRSMFSKDWLAKALSIGFLAGSIGLLVNAAYIDVYASSKVAQSYWALAGLVLAYAYLNNSVGGPLAFGRPAKVTLLNATPLPPAAAPSLVRVPPVKARTKKNKPFSDQTKTKKRSTRV